MGCLRFSNVHVRYCVVECMPLGVHIKFGLVCSGKRIPDRVVGV
jgi:hypothetical protein